MQLALNNNVDGSDRFGYEVKITSDPSGNSIAIPLADHLSEVAINGLPPDPICGRISYYDLGNGQFYNQSFQPFGTFIEAREPHHKTLIGTGLATRIFYITVEQLRATVGSNTSAMHGTNITDHFKVLLEKIGIQLGQRYPIDQYVEVTRQAVLSKHPEWAIE